MKKESKVKTKWLIVMLSVLVVLFAASGLVLHFILGKEEEKVVHQEEQQGEDEQEEVVQTPGHVDISWYDDSKTEFTITTIQQLNGISLLAMTYDFEGKTIKLGADVTMNEGDASTWRDKEPDYSYTPIGKMQKPFKGNFDGQGHTISGLYVMKDHTVGLFSFTQGSVIKNIRLVNSYFEVTGAPTASGEMFGFCSSIVGRAVGCTLENLYSDAILVSGAKMNAGIVGEVLNNDQNFIRNCWFAGSLESAYQDNQQSFEVNGGILGAAHEDVVIEHCLNTGTIKGKGGMVGGLVGWTSAGNKLVMRDCLNAGKVEASSPQDWFQSGTISYARYQSVVELEKVYSTTESCVHTNVRSDRATVNGSVSAFPEDKIKGIDGYKRTGLDFKNYWVAVKDSTPELKAFSKGAQIETKGVAKAADYIDTSWYKENKKTFTLKTIQELNGLAYLVKSNTFEGKTIKLGADITMNEGVASEWKKKEPSAIFTQIGDNGAPFEGTFDGQGHTISGIYIKNDLNVGLFGWTGAKSTIKNFRLENSYIEGTGRVLASVNNAVWSDVGSIAGVGGGRFENIYSNAIVEGTGSFGGGLIGLTRANVTMKNCQFDGSVTLCNAVEGIKNAGEIAGGLIGCVENKTIIESCNFTGNIWCEGVTMGGFVGRVMNVNLMLKACMTSGSVNSHIADAAKRYMACYAVGYLNTNATANIEDTYVYQNGNATALGRAEKSDAWKGGFTYYSKNRADFVGLQTRATKLLNYDEWILTADLPKLKSFTDDKAIVDVSWYDADKETFKIKNVEQLYGLSFLVDSNTFEGKTILLTKDLTLNEGAASGWKTTVPGKVWRPIGDINTPFEGTFDGQGHTISGIYVKRDLNVGFFGWTGATSTVKNLRLENSYIEATGRIIASMSNQVWSDVGSIAGVGGGSFENVYSDAIVEGTGLFGGGLVGLTRADVTMKNCQYAGSIKMYNSTIGANNKGECVGGLVGSVENATTIENCNFTGSVWGEGVQMGGFVARVMNVALTLDSCLTSGSVNSAVADVANRYMTCNAVGYMNTNAIANLKNTYVYQYGNATALGRAEKSDAWKGGFTYYSANRADFVGLQTKATALLLNSEWIITEDLPELKAFTDAEAIADTSWYDTEKTTYKINDIKDFYGFMLLGQNCSFVDKKIILKTDITLNEGDAATGFAQTAIQWRPVGNNSYPFAGTFDGDNHTISGLTSGVSGQSVLVGFFGTIADGTVENLKINNSRFAGKNQIGALAGVANSATIKKVDITAYVQASGGYIGGFIGQHVNGTLTLTDCNMHGTVTSAAEIAGGFCGRVENSNVTISFIECTNEASVSVTGTQAGGFIGRMANGVIATFTNSTNKGSVHATSTQVAGFVGGLHNSGSINISGSLNQGAISSNGSYVGGFVAYTGGTSVSITDSINEGTVTGTELVGGFFGNPSKTISVTGCQNKANITGSTNGVGGIVGQMGGGTLTINGSSNSGIVKASGNGIGGLVGKTYGNTTIVQGTNTGAVGTLGAGRCTGGIVGFAETGSVLEVKNSSNKGTVAGNDVIGGIVGTANIGIAVTDCTNENTVTSKVQPAGGIFGYAIKGTTSLTRCENKSAVIGPKVIGGMIGQIDAVATVSFTSCTNRGAIEGGQHSMGGFVGDAYGAVTITDGLNTGKIGCTSNSAGGFIGYVRTSSAAEVSISNSKNQGDFAGTSSMGGFVGQALRAVSFTNCQNEGNYNGAATNVGGFIGLASDSVTIKKSKNTGTITTSGTQIGGLIGTMKKGDNASFTLTIEQSSNNGKITATGGNTAGFIGYAENVPTMVIRESQNIGQIHNNGTATNFAGFIGWMNGGAVTIENCLNAGEITSSTNNGGGFIGTLAGTATINKCLNVGVITNTAQYAQVGSFIGNAPGTWTITNSYASKESCANYLYQYKNGATQWLKDNTIQVSAANLTGAAAKTNAPELDWDSIWVTSNGFPKLKCFEPVAVQTKLAAQEPTLYQQVVKLLKAIF